MPPLGRAFIWANFIPKLGAVGGLYLAAPTRLCAFYRLDQQELAGRLLIAVAIALGVAWFVAAFVGWTPSCMSQPRHSDETRPWRSSSSLPLHGQHRAPTP